MTWMRGADAARMVLSLVDDEGGLCHHDEGSGGNDALPDWARNARDSMSSVQKRRKEAAKCWSVERPIVSGRDWLGSGLRAERAAMLRALRLRALEDSGAVSIGGAYLVVCECGWEASAFSRNAARYSVMWHFNQTGGTDCQNHTARCVSRSGVIRQW